jgi:hypothetical protein
MLPGTAWNLDRRTSQHCLNNVLFGELKKPKGAIREMRPTYVLWHMGGQNVERIHRFDKRHRIAGLHQGLSRDRNI